MSIQCRSNTKGSKQQNDDIHNEDSEPHMVLNLLWEALKSQGNFTKDRTIEQHSQNSQG